MPRRSSWQRRAVELRFKKKGSATCMALVPFGDRTSQKRQKKASLSSLVQQLGVEREGLEISSDDEGLLEGCYSLQGV